MIHHQSRLANTVIDNDPNNYISLIGWNDIICGGFPIFEQEYSEFESITMRQY